MNSIDKLIKKLKSKPKDFTWDELTRLLGSLNFEEITRGKTSGSRRKFYNKQNELIINLHKPHPQPIIKPYLMSLFGDKKSLAFRRREDIMKLPQQRIYKEI